MWIEAKENRFKQSILVNSDKVEEFGICTNCEKLTITAGMAGDNFYNLGTFNERKTAEAEFDRLQRALTNNYSYHRIIGDDEG